MRRLLAILAAAVDLGDDMACERCGDPVEPDTGCFCDGHVLCSADLMECGECRAAAGEDWRADHPMDAGVWP